MPAVCYARLNTALSGNALATMYAELFTQLEEAGAPPDPAQVRQAEAELSPLGYTLDRDDSGAWTAVRARVETYSRRPRLYARLGNVWTYAAARSPVGGVDIAGTHFSGGQFIPGKELAKATPEVKAKVEAGQKDADAKAAAKKAERTAKGPVDKTGLLKRLEPHAPDIADTTDDAKVRARAAWRMLKQHHGEHALHRVDELAGMAQAALDRVKGDGARAESLRSRLGETLAKLHYLASELHGAEGERIVAAHTIGGETHVGKVVEVDNGTAVIEEPDGKHFATGLDGLTDATVDEIAEAKGEPSEPAGFTGTAGNGHEWKDGVQVARAEEPATPDGVMSAFDALEGSAREGMVPIHELRRAVAEKYGPAAATHEAFDAMLHDLRKAGKVRLVAIGNGGDATPEQLADSIPGEKETYFVVERKDAPTPREAASAAVERARDEDTPEARAAAIEAHEAADRADREREKARIDALRTPGLPTPQEDAAARSHGFYRNRFATTRKDGTVIPANAGYVRRHSITGAFDTFTADEVRAKVAAAGGAVPTAKIYGDLADRARKNGDPHSEAIYRKQAEEAAKARTYARQGEAARYAAWTPYEGPRGGKGWKNAAGDVVYGDEPGDGEAGPAPDKAAEPSDKTADEPSKPQDSKVYAALRSAAGKGVADFAHVGHKAAHLEHVAKAFLADGVPARLARLPAGLRQVAEGLWFTTKLGTRAAFLTYSAGQSFAERVARERGMDDASAARLRGVCTALDLSGAKAVPLTLSAVGLGGLAVASSFVPVGSFAYLAYSTAKDPLAVIRAARKLVQRDRGEAAKQYARGDAAPAFDAGVLAGLLAGTNGDRAAAVFLAALDAAGDAGEALAFARRECGGGAARD